MLWVFLAAVFAFSVYQNVSVSVKTEEAVQKLEQVQQTEKLTKKSKKIIEQWKAEKNDKLVDAACACGFFIIIMMLVRSVGRVQEAPGHISKEEAQRLAKEIDEEYIKNNQLVEKRIQGNEEFVPDSLSMPKLISAVFADRCVTVRWEKVSYAQGYIIFRREENKKWVRVGKVGSEQTEFSDYALESDKTYIYSVRAYLQLSYKRITSKLDGMGLEVYVSSGNMPDTPELYKETDEQGGRLVAWNPVQGAKLYRVYRKSADGTWELLDRVPKEQLSYSDPRLKEGTSGIYTVSACKIINKHAVVGRYDETGIEI